MVLCRSPLLMSSNSWTRNSTGSTVLTAEVRDHIRASAHLLWNDSDGLGATGEDGLLVLANTPEPLVRTIARSRPWSASCSASGRPSRGATPPRSTGTRTRPTRPSPSTDLAALASEKASDAEARVREFEARRASRWRRVPRPSTPVALGSVLAIILAIGLVAALLFARGDDD